MLQLILSFIGTSALVRFFSTKIQFQWLTSEFFSRETHPLLFSRNFDERRIEKCVWPKNHLTIETKLDACKRCIKWFFGTVPSLFITYDTKSIENWTLKQKKVNILSSSENYLSAKKSEQVAIMILVERLIRDVRLVIFCMLKLLKSHFEKNHQIIATLTAAMRT